jgi:diguanylate cyclase (GGDEF)-like protein
MFDIDHFKQVNDTYGHAMGDLVLQQVASTAQSLLRQSDTICRYGGEEFVILMPETTQESAAKVAERMRQAFADLVFRSSADTFGITVSFGVASLNYHEAELQNGLETFEQLLQAADQALYVSKNSGRNRVSLASC